jgi:hypothetical protein
MSCLQLGKVSTCKVYIGVRRTSWRSRFLRVHSRQHTKPWTGRTRKLRRKGRSRSLFCKDRSRLRACRGAHSQVGCQTGQLQCNGAQYCHSPYANSDPSGCCQVGKCVYLVLASRRFAWMFSSHRRQRVYLFGFGERLDDKFAELSPPTGSRRAARHCKDSQLY